MKDRPILFSGPMVRAILADTKTQTRRVFQPRGWDLVKLQTWRFVHVLSNAALSALSCRQPGDAAYAGFLTSPDSVSASYFKCPYGQPGDRLWVRETARCDYRGEHTPPGGPASCAIGVTYAAGGVKLHAYAPGERDKFAWFPSRSSNRDLSPRWAPAIHMPRWASRILLEIVSVRIERLQEISDVDALAEGITSVRCDDWDSKHFPDWKRQFDAARAAGTKPPLGPTPAESFAALWSEINGADSWQGNPWVWVVEFKRLEGGGHHV